MSERHQKHMDQEQANLAAERMEAGRAELMQLLEGVPGAEKMAELLEKGKKKGKLSAGDMMEALDELNLDSEQMDKLYDIMENLGIDAAGDEEDLNDLEMDDLDSLDVLGDDDLIPPPEELEEGETVPEEEVVDPNALADTFSIDDPVRMYLKEIGKVNLLTPEEEIELAQDMGAGDAAREQLDAILDGVDIHETRRRLAQKLRHSPTVEEVAQELDMTVEYLQELLALEKVAKKGERAKQRLAEAIIQKGICHT